MSDISSKLGAARTRLILEQPFLGALLLHLPLVPADAAWCVTTATDARAIYYNPAWLDRLTFAETRFVLAHEVLHCALGHFARRDHRTRRRWDVATDHAVNLLLLQEGLKPPPGALANPAFRGLSAEEIYPLIPPDTEERAFDRHLFGESAPAAVAPQGARSSAPASRAPVAPAIPRDRYDGKSERDSDSWDDAGNERRTITPRVAPPLDASASGEELARLWQGRVVSVAQQARIAGRFNDSWLRLVDGLVGRELPWRSILARYVMGVARSDYSFRRPSRRDGEALLPRLAGAEADLCVALDTSGSIAAEELVEFTAELDALKGQVRARVTVLACDERLDARGPWIFEPWEAIVLPLELAGGGGTSFLPVFDRIAERCLRPDLLVYFTDAEGEFPRRAPDYPVIWVVKGRGKVPWGERIQLN